MTNEPVAADTTPVVRHFPLYRIAVTEALSVEVSAMPTVATHLVITPGVGVTDDGSVTFASGGLYQLTHALTGRSVASSESIVRLKDLAQRLAGFDWSFDEPQYFAATTAGKKQAALVVPIIRDWQMSDAYDGPVHFSGDDDLTKQARQSAPALTLLREHIDWYMKAAKARIDKDLINTNADLWHAAIATECEGYGLIYLLAVLTRIDPKIADIAARDLVAAWEGGEFGEWVWQWDSELANDRPLTLHGIPAAEPLADFQ